MLKIGPVNYSQKMHWLLKIINMRPTCGSHCCDDLAVYSPCIYEAAAHQQSAHKALLILAIRMRCPHGPTQCKHLHSLFLSQPNRLDNIDARVYVYCRRNVSDR